MLWGSLGTLWACSGDVLRRSADIVQSCGTLWGRSKALWDTLYLQTPDEAPKRPDAILESCFFAFLLAKRQGIIEKKSRGSRGAAISMERTPFFRWDSH